MAGVWFCQSSKWSLKLVDEVGESIKMTLNAADTIMSEDTYPAMIANLTVINERRMHALIHLRCNRK